MKVDKNTIPEDLLNHIELPENLDRLVAESVEKGYKHMKRKKGEKRTVMMKRAAIILGIVAAGGAVTIPVKAFVTSIVQERMEQAPQEEMNELLENVDAQQAEADSFTRDYTNGEKERMASLSKAYNQGTFPENELRLEETKNSETGGELYFAQDTATFFLPERELTDEELLQIIDFAARRDYVLEQRFEKEQGEEQRKKAQEMSKNLADAGGLSEQQAKERGKELLQSLYGETGEGMELYFYLDGDASSGKGQFYRFGYSLKSVRSCSVELNAMDGSLIQTHETVVADDLDAAPVGTAELEKKADALYQTARETLVNKLGKESEYDKVIMAYNEVNGHLGYANQVSFFFIKQDGSAYEVTMSPVRDRISGYRERKSLDEYKTEMEYRLAKRTDAEKGSMIYKEMQ